MIGETISHYRITEKLGEGGMGEVYRARDTKLNRDVALKILPQVFAQDSQRMARFEREAQVLAWLNHTNIAQIHGLEETDGTKALVLELVDGETLQEQIARGPIPVDEALKIALQICEGLEAAHEKGVIHRDLKPANIKITPDGQVKILDFGLAKALEGEKPVSDLSHSPTITHAATQAGVILGTASYMSPEQARGKVVDKRADIWAFGAVLFEMLTGKQVFQGETVSDVLASVLARQPDLDLLPPELPALVRSVLRRCLRKNSLERLHDIGDARIEIAEALEEPASISATPVKNGPRSLRWKIAVPWSIAALLAVLAGITIWNSSQPEPLPVTEFRIMPTDDAPLADTVMNDVAISPDGRTIVYSAMAGGTRQLFVRNLGDLTARPVPGTERAVHPFFSPDSRWMAFFTSGKLAKVSLSGGPSVGLCEIPQYSVRGSAKGSWRNEGTILFSVYPPGSLYRVSAGGGEPEVLLEPDPVKGESFHSPQMLPGEKAVLFFMWDGGQNVQTVVLSLETGHTKLLMEGVGRYVSTGHLICGSILTSGTLMGATFDLAGLEVTGERVPILQGIRQDMPGYPDVALSENGTLIFVPDTGAMRSLVWVDRAGRRLGQVGRPGLYRQIVLSPAEKQVALESLATQGGYDIWLLDLRTGITSRFTINPADERDPVWSPSGDELMFLSSRSGPGDLYRKAIDGSDAELVFASDARKVPEDWSQDGDFVIFKIGASYTDTALYSLPLGDVQEPVPLIDQPFMADEFELSPDGKWIAYNSEESGSSQVYVASYPTFTPRRQVSSNGGCQPQWREDGRELYYLQLDGKLMSVEIAAGQTVTAGIPSELFQTNIEVAPALDQYCATADGQRFLFTGEVAETAGEIQVVLNWFEELKRLVPTE